MLFIQRIRKYLAYFWGKKRELTAMDDKDLLLAKVVLDIHRYRSHTSPAIVPLYSLLPVHPINRPSSIETTRKRSANLSKNRQLLLQRQLLDRETLIQYIPSVSAIKVVANHDGQSYFAFEGNGRLAAMLLAFREEDDMRVEVEEYHIADHPHIQKQLNELRELHQLLERETFLTPLNH